MAALVDDPVVLVDDPGFTVNGVSLEGAGLPVVGPRVLKLDVPTSVSVLGRPTAVETL